MNNLIRIQQGDIHMGRKSISKNKINFSIRELSKKALKKWSGDIDQIEEAGCDFCSDAAGRCGHEESKCEVCHAPQYLCYENSSVYSLYNVFEFMNDDDNYNIYVYKVVTMMRIALCSMIIFGRVIFPIKWYCKWFLRKFKKENGIKDD